MFVTTYIMLNICLRSYKFEYEKKEEIKFCFRLGNVKLPEGV